MKRNVNSCQRLVFIFHTNILTGLQGGVLRVQSSEVTWGQLPKCVQEAEIIFLGMENTLHLTVCFHYIKKWTCYNKIIRKKM